MGALLAADFFDEWLGWLVTGLLPDVRAHFRLDYAQAGWVLTAHLAGGYVGAIVGGVLADVWNRRRLLLGGAALFASGLALVGVAPSFAVTLVGCACIGLASGPVVHTAQVILVERARQDGQRLERFLARFNALGSVGDVLGPTFLAVGLSAGLGWRALFGAGALVMTAYGVTLAGATRHAPLVPAARDSERPAWSLVVATLADHRVLRLALALALLDALDEPFAGFVMLYLRDVVGASEALSNLAVAVLVGSTLGGFALAAHLGWTRGRAMRVFLGTLTAGTAAFLLLPGLPAKVACLALVGVSTAGFYTSALAEALSLRPDTTGTTTSVLSLVGIVSLALPPLVGAVSDSRNLTSGMILYAGLAALMLLLVGRLGGPTASVSSPRVS